MATSHLSAQEQSQAFSSRRRTIALVIVALAFVMDLLDSTIVNIAIPSIQANLGASYATIQWLVSGYLLAFALLLITGGRMGDVFGYKKVFMFGVTGFTFASLLSGLAWDPTVLVAARLLQGAAAALMVPQVMSLMQVMYKPEERASISGIFGALGGLAASAGPILGGMLIKANLFGLDWRPIFLVNIPIGLFALIAGGYALPKGKSPHPLKLDWIGTLLVMLGMLLVVFPLVQGRDLGWPLWTFIMMAAMLPVLAAFLWYERRRNRTVGSPLVVLSLFRVPSFTLGLFVNVLFEMTMIGFFFIFTLVLQAGLGFDVLKAALTGIPTAIGISVSIAVLGQKLIPKLGRYLLTFGALLMAAGLLSLTWAITHFGLNASGWDFALELLATGAGMGLVMAPLFAVVLNDVDVAHAGAASGILNAIQQVGGAIGVAIIGVVFFGQLTSQANHSIDQVMPQLKHDLTAAHVPAGVQDQMATSLRACFNDRINEKDSSVVPASCQTAQTMPTQPGSDIIGKALMTAGKQANANNFITALHQSIWYVMVLLAAILGLSFFLPRHIRGGGEGA